MPQYQLDAQGRRLEPGDEGYNWGRESTSFDPLADAQSFLADPTRSQAPQPTEADTAEANRLTSSPAKPMSLRSLTDIGEAAALPLGVMGMVPSPVSPFLLGSSAVLSGAGGLRKLINPEEDESRVGGAVQSAFSGLPMLGASMRGLKGLGGQAMKRFPISTEKAYQMGEQPQSLQALRETVGQIVPKSILNTLPESWRQFASTVAPKVAQRAPAEIKRTPKGMLSKMNRESEAGYRNTLPETNTTEAFQKLPKGGLESITPEEWRRLGLRQVGEHLPSYTTPVDETADYGGDLLQELLGNSKRLGIPARARAFRNNTPFTE